MMMVHELGHVLGAYATGGRVREVFHDPFSFSYTALAHNPHPLVVAWAGPLLGVLIPLAAFGIARLLRVRWTYLLRFFAGFCLIANGGYIGASGFMRIADGGDLLRHGASLASLVVFGLLCVAAGLALWHKLGPSFGLGAAKGKVSPVAAYFCLLLLIAAIDVMRG